MGIKSISTAFHVSRNTVRKYVRRYQESGLTLEQLTAMSEEKLQKMFLDDCNRSHKPTPRREALEALVPDYVKRLSRKGEKKYLPQAFRTCQGIMSLEGKYGLARLVAACACASEGRLYGYNEVKEILERGDDVDFMPSVTKQSLMPCLTESSTSRTV
jgi:hypothetical protein